MKYIRIGFIVLFLLSLTSLIVQSQQKHDFFDKKNQSTEKTIEETRLGDKYQRFYQISQSLWPKVTIFGVYSAVIVYVALVFGVGSYFIGWNAGAKLNKRKVNASIATATLVGILGRSFIIMIQKFLNDHVIKLLIKDDFIAGTVSETIIYIFWIIFIAGISVYFYETFTVTAKEAHPMG